MKKYISIGFVALLLAVGTFSSSAQAATKDLSGWAWSSNIGWVSFNGSDSGAGGNYKVQFDTTTGNLSGYGWSSNVGWISFNSSALLAQSPAPACPGTSPVHVDTVTGDITGWARVYSGITGYANGGWDGCIKLSDGVLGSGSPLFPTRATSGDKGVTYVPIDATKGSLKGFSWGSDVIGWLRFNPKADVDTDVVVDPGGGGTIAVNCTASPTGTVAPGTLVTFTASTPTGGTAPYTYSWSGGPYTSTNTSGVTYSANGSGPTLIVHDSVTPTANTGSATCPSVSVSAPASDLTLAIGRTAATASASSLSIKKGDSFGLQWANSIPSGYTCSPSVSAGSWPAWSTATVDDPSGTVSFTGANTANLTQNSYTFTISCTKPSSPLKTTSVILKVTSSTIEEI